MGGDIRQSSPLLAPDFPLSPFSSVSKFSPISILGGVSVGATRDWFIWSLVSPPLVILIFFLIDTFPQASPPFLLTAPLPLLLSF